MFSRSIFGPSNEPPIPRVTIFLASVISLFAGIQLLVLGVIGEYLSIVHNRTSNLPSYVIEKEVKKD